MKIGEYLAVGLPVVVTDGIGDYSDLIERERLGVVLKELSPARYLESADLLNSLWAEGDQLRERCRAVAEAKRTRSTISTSQEKRSEALAEGCSCGRMACTSIGKEMCG